MKKLILAILVISSPVFSCDGPYLKVGAGYKFSESDKFHDSVNGGMHKIENADPLSARIEIGKEHGKWSYGVSHHSQWRTGFPFNDKKELHKTELFLDYKFSF